jgi:hypothetical protein
VQIGTALGLLLVQRLLEEGRRQAEAEEPLAAMQSILLLDAAVERSLGLLLSEVAPSAIKEREPKFGQLLDAAVKILASKDEPPMPGVPDLSNLHRLRNLVQHQGFEVPPAQAQRFAEPAREAIAFVFSRLGHDLSRFHRWDVIRNDDLRCLMQEAETALEQGSLEWCLAGCIIAHRAILEVVLGHKGEIFRISSDVRNAMGRLRIPGGNALQAGFELASALEGLVDRVNDEISYLRTETATLTSGLPAADAIAFLACSRSLLVYSTYGGYSIGGWRNDTSVRPDAGEFMLGCIWRWAWQLQMRDPALVAQIRVEYHLDGSTHVAGPPLPA